MTFLGKTVHVYACLGGFRVGPPLKHREVSTDLLARGIDIPDLANVGYQAAAKSWCTFMDPKMGSCLIMLVHLRIRS